MIINGSTTFYILWVFTAVTDSKCLPLAWVSILAHFTTKCNAMKNVRIADACGYVNNMMS
jgi:hypothetical protein